MYQRILMRDITRTSRSCLCATLLACVVAFVSPVASAEWLRADKAIMGTAIEVQLWAEDAARGEAAVEAVIEELHRIDNLMSTWKPESEISRINSGAAKVPVPAGEELRSLIKQAQTISEHTRGAFDITYASVGFLYDYRERVRPDDTAVAGALESVGYRFVTVDDDEGTVSYAREGVRIDLGGIAKGYAVERGIVILRNRGQINNLDPLFKGLFDLEIMSWHLALTTTINHRHRLGTGTGSRPGYIHCGVTTTVDHHVVT